MPPQGMDFRWTPSPGLEVCLLPGSLPFGSKALKCGREQAFEHFQMPRQEKEDLR